MLLPACYKLYQFVLHHEGRIVNRSVDLDELFYDAKMHATDVSLPINDYVFLEFPINTI